MSRKLILSLLGLTTVFVATSAAQAHPRLIGATPDPNSTGAAPRTIQMRFNERLIAPLSGANLAVMRVVGSTVSRPVQVPAVTTVYPYEMKIIVLPKRPLVPGHYTLNWQAVSVDTHRVQGSFGFTVKAAKPSLAH